MSATRWQVLALLALATAALGFLLGERAYGEIPSLSATAPIILALVAAVEAALAGVIRDRLRADPRPGLRRLYPEQVARAAMLAKASSPSGAVFAGGYAGLLVFLIGDGTAAASNDRPYAAVAVAAALALVVAALVLERACRLPDDRQDGQDAVGPTDTA